MANFKFTTAVVLMALFVSAGAALFAFDGNADSDASETYIFSDVDGMYFFTVIDGTDEVKISAGLNFDEYAYRNVVELPTEATDPADGKIYRVTTIASMGFLISMNKGLILPGDSDNSEGIERIEDYAFCSGPDSIHIKSFNLPSTLVYVGDMAFAKVNTEMDELYIGPNLVHIGESAFAGISCGKITVDSGNPYYRDVNGVLFDRDETILMSVPRGCDVDGNSFIPETVEYIEPYAAFGLGQGSDIGTLYIPSQVKRIGASAFQNTGFGNLVFAKNSHLEIICNDAFSTANLWAFETLVFPDSLKVIEENAFRDVGVETVKFGKNLEYIGTWAFKSNPIKTIEMSPSIKVIEAEAFVNISLEMELITFPSTLEYLGDGAFSRSVSNDISSIDVIFEGDEPIIEYGALSFSRGQDLTINLTAGEWATNTVLNKITLGDKTVVDGFDLIDETLTDDHFKYVSYDGKTAVLVGYKDGVSSCADPVIGGYVYKEGDVGHENPYTVVGAVLVEKYPYFTGDATILSTVKYIRGLFYYCNVTSVTMEEGLVCIGANSFKGCDGLTSINIPDSVVAIGNGTFYRSGLTSVTIGDGVKFISGSSFNELKIESIKLGSSIEYIGNSAFGGNVNKENLVFGENLAYVGSGAFAGHYSMDTVEFKGNRPVMGTASFKYSGDYMSTLGCNYKVFVLDEHNLTVITPGWGDYKLFNSMFGSSVSYEVRYSSDGEVSLPAFVAVSAILALVLVASVAVYWKKR